MEYVHGSGKKVEFNTLTESKTHKVTSLFKERFRAEEARDSFEYIHKYKSLVDMSGPEFARRRQDINYFNKIYGDRTVIKVIEESDLDDLRTFQEYWNADHKERCRITGKKIIDYESEGIMKTFDHFGELPVRGIVLRVEGVVRGYAYGMTISNNVFDVLVEKGDRGIKDVYRPINRELVRMCAEGHELINREEDCGDPGLRASKLSLNPEILLKKYIVGEV